MDSKRGLRTGRARSHRRSPTANLLSDANLTELDERLGTTRVTRHEHHPGKGVLSGLRLSHVALLLVGIVVGIGLYMAGQYLLRHPAPPAKPTPPPAATEPQASAPAPEPAPAQPHPISSSDPATIVRAMLKAALAGDDATAAAYWGIGPTDIAFTGNGLEVSLQDALASTRRGVAKTPPDQLDLRPGRRAGETLTLNLYEGGTCTQVYSLRRLGNTWKIMNATLP